MEGLDLVLDVGLLVDRAKEPNGPRPPEGRACRPASESYQLVFQGFHGRIPWGLKVHRLELLQEKDGAYLLVTDSLEGARRLGPKPVSAFASLGGGRRSPIRRSGQAVTETSAASVLSRREEHAQRLGIEPDRVHLVTLQLSHLAHEGTLVDLDVEGLSRFTRHLSWEQLGIVPPPKGRSSSPPARTP